MATDATGTPTSPDSIARILPSDAPAVTTLTSGINAIADTVQTALSANYLRKTSGNVVNADINAAAAIAYSKLNLAGSVTNADLAGSITGAKLTNGTVTGTQIATDVALAGNPTTTTQAVDNSTTRLATTAYVVGQAAAATPGDVLATAAVGTSTRFARGDHTHKLHTGIWDGTGTASRLNPITIYSHAASTATNHMPMPDGTVFRAGINGEGALISGGWFDASVSSAVYHTCPWDWNGWNAAGGTVQWRWLFAFNINVSPTGTNTASLSYLYLDDSGGSSSGGVSGAQLVSFTNPTGIKTIDSGWQTAPAGPGTGLLVPNWTTTRTGGASGGTYNRSQCIIKIRNV